MTSADKELRNKITFGVLLGAIVLGFISAFISAWIIKSKLEADAFNNATGKQVSTWDAMWIELRIQEPAK